MTRSSLQNFYNMVVRGLASSPRGLAVNMVTDTNFYFAPGVIYTRPRMNLNIGFVEMLQFISSTFNVETIKKVAPNARLDLFTGQSAYGPRTVGQIQRAIDELKRDMPSRRAVIMIAHHDDTSETIPCTLSMQFQVVDERLHTTITMRSSDLIWGLPTDIIQFGGIAQVVSNCLLLKRSGLCTIRSANSHVYKNTALNEGEEYVTKGSFKLPNFTSYSTYVEWANDSLRRIDKGLATVKNIIRIEEL